MDFRTYRDTPLSAFAQFVHDNMLGNAAFPAPDVPLATLQQQITDYNQALEATHTGDRIATSVLKQRRAALKASLLTQARYVNHVAYDDEGKIISSGFNHSSGQRHGAVVPEAPRIMQFQVEHATGAVSLRASAVKDARSYMAIVEAVQEQAARMNERTVVLPPGAVAVCASIQRKMRISGLQSGVRCRVRVYAVGTAGVSVGSSAVEFIAQ